MFWAEIVILRLLAIVMIGVTMYCSMLFVIDLLHGTRPLKKRNRGEKRLEIDGFKFSSLMVGIILFAIMVFIFLFIKYILRGAV